MTRAPLLVALAVCSWVTASSRTAHAGVFLGAELEGAAGFDMPPGTHLGYGFLGALGYRIGIGPVFLQPEAQAGYTLFPGAFTPPHAARVLGGVRFGYWGKFQPAFFAHAGAGWLGSDANGPALDAGLSLSFKLVPFFVFGAQGAYNVVMVLSESSATRWVSFGLHAGVEL
jgi:hypothetical protein